MQGLGHKEDGATEGRRTTRSSTRGSTTPATPPPAKREKKTPSTARGVYKNQFVNIYNNQ